MPVQQTYASGGEVFILNFQALFLHFREMKHYFIASTMVFFIGTALGYAYSAQFSVFIESQLQGLGEIAQKLAQTDHPQLSFFIFIFLNNSIKSIFIVFAGALFGVLPILFLVVNGMILGYLGALKMDEQMLAFFLKGIMPHGVIEIPAIIVACAYGLRFGSIVSKSLIGLVSVKRRLAAASEIRRFIKLTVPLMLLLTFALFVAAIIESSITFWLVRS
jgi:stage II sporulation protein M